jgi:hypothetical protein
MIAIASMNQGGRIRGLIATTGVTLVSATSTIGGMTASTSVGGCDHVDDRRRDPPGERAGAVARSWNMSIAFTGPIAPVIMGSTDAS